MAAPARINKEATSMRERACPELSPVSGRVDEAATEVVEEVEVVVTGDEEVVFVGAVVVGATVEVDVVGAIVVLVEVVVLVVVDVVVSGVMHGPR